MVLWLRLSVCWIPINVTTCMSPRGGREGREMKFKYLNGKRTIFLMEVLISFSKKTISGGIFKWPVLVSVSESHKQKLPIVW